MVQLTYYHLPEKDTEMTDGKTDIPKNDIKLMSSGILLRLIVIVLVLELGSLLLGVAFFLMVHGLIFAMLWLLPYWEPVYRIYACIFRLPQDQFARVPITWWRIILLGLKAIVVIYCLGAGLWILVTNGFLGQNFIYALLQSASR
jgi:hypothetical protein